MRSKPRRVSLRGGGWITAPESKPARPTSALDPIRSLGERRLAEALWSGQIDVLELITSGAPLDEVLARLTLVIEAQAEAEGMLCSVIVLEPDGRHLRHAAAPSLPQAYTAAIDGEEIGPRAGSCGTAAFRREPVFVTDIETDPLWDGYRELALEHGLRACWSTPIFSRDGSLLGTFAMYYREPRVPTGVEARLVELATHLAAIAIERAQADEELRVLRAKARSE